MIRLVGAMKVIFIDNLFFFQLSSQIGDRTLFLSPDDSISLSLEYYQAKLDTTDLDEEKISGGKIAKKDDNSDAKHTDGTENSNKINDRRKSVASKDSDVVTDKDSDSASDDKAVKSEAETETGDDKDINKECDKRYLRCPAAVLMKHLQKFIRLKNGLTADHRVSDKKH